MLKKKKKRKLKTKKNEQSIKETSEVYPGLTESPSKNGLESVSPGTKVSEVGAASGTPYFSCEDVDMSEFNMEKTNLGLLPDFANSLVSVTGQTKSGPEAPIQIYGSGIGNGEQETGDSRPTKRSQESTSSQEIPMDEEEEKDKEDGELEEETEDSEILGSDIKIPQIYRLIAHYFPKSERYHILFMLEERAEGDKMMYYSWAVDKRYDLSLMLQFELDYLTQEEDWPAEPYDRMWPGYI
ncbi:MAG: hypothetical protein GY861_15060, partial [bacterium]|nr:hypothetical protein [bacterium]